MNTTANLAETARRVAAADPRACRVVTGFDGFVDEMISLVGERRGLDDFTPVPDIATFGSLISATAGNSSLREIVIIAAHPGGCAVNLADGLASLGVVVDCFATLGEPMHPAFGEIAADCHGFHSWGREPGRTLAFEFSDGKLMFSAVKQLAGLRPEAARGFLAGVRVAAGPGHQPRGRPPEFIRGERRCGGRLYPNGAVLPESQEEHRRGRPLQRRILPRPGTVSGRRGLARSWLRGRRVFRSQRPQCELSGTDRIPAFLGRRIPRCS
jgi:hypothetical protein